MLNLAGAGSVRHLWFTWSVPGSSTVPLKMALLRIYIDNASTPSIVGTVDQLCRAAEATGTRYIPFPAFVYKDTYNFYLPIFFGKSIRIEVEALSDMQEFYTQIDYRLDTESRTSSRLVSSATEQGVELHYTNPALLSRSEYSSIKTEENTHSMLCDSNRNSCFVAISGYGILRTLSLPANIPPDAVLMISWDDEEQPSVNSPIRYFFGGFTNAAIETTENQLICRFPMPFFRKARIEIHSKDALPAVITLSYAIERAHLPASALYFHALYHEQHTTGYAQFPVLRVVGRGVFLGLNLFDSGHNHGGGDAALIDAGTSRPQVLHGICGEDYFGFAWHHTGTMTPLTGAPVHERRYRLHLENPYPFRESFQFLFGVFAGQNPKSVAFWYQAPEPPKTQKWVSFEIPWKVLGPVASSASLPQSVNERSYETEVPFNVPLKLTEHWQDAKMTSGGLDLTYQFRHYVLIEKGTGFIAGASKYGLITRVYSPISQTVNAVLGHDDCVVVDVNGRTVARLGSQSGFGGSPIRLPFRVGWNQLNVLVSNEENANWRWAGISLAFERSKSHGLTFSEAVDITGTGHTSSVTPRRHTVN